jgi:8-oxo-dGTP pyrophosphatase MutT (NUDIX family)
MGQASRVTSSDPPLVDKVVAYVVRSGNLAVFVHLDDHDPLLESGLQVPAGTVLPGESPQVAVLRETEEESGLTGLRVAAALGVEEYDMRPTRHEIHRRHFFQLAVAGDVPELWDHDETDGGGGAPRPFRFFWIPVEQGHALTAGFGALLSRVDPAVGQPGC